MPYLIAALTLAFSTLAIWQVCEILDFIDSLTDQDTQP